MKKIITITIIGLFLGVAVAPSINADVKEPEIVEPELVEAKFENLIVLVEGVISYYERTYGPFPDEDCGCEEKGTTEWKFPFICFLLFTPYYYCFLITVVFGLNWGFYFPNILKLLEKFLDIGDSLNCFWMPYI